MQGLRFITAWAEIIKFVMSSFKQKVSFSLNFGSLFSVRRNKSSVLFLLKLYMIWTKGNYQGAKFQTSNCSCKISPNLYFDRLLELYRTLAKTWGVMYLDPEDWCKFEGKLICCFKNHNNLVNFELSTEKSPKFSL